MQSQNHILLRKRVAELGLWQAREQFQHSRIIRRPETSYQVPAFGRVEPVSHAAPIVAYCDVVKDVWVLLLLPAWV